MQNNFEIISRVIIINDGKILLYKAKDLPHYFFPGGHVEFEEYDLASIENHIEFSWHNTSSILEVNLLPEVARDEILGWIKNNKTF